MPPGPVDTLQQSSATIRDAIESIDCSPYRIALVVDQDQHLLGTITDGDIRRALMSGKSADAPASSIMYADPITASAEGPSEDTEQRARQRLIRQVPLIDADGRVVGVHTVGDIGNKAYAENNVVIMAGGLGTRLLPLTEEAPKPLLDVGEKPMLETIVDQLVAQGFRKFHFSVRYKAEMVEQHFGDGTRWNAEFHYLHEDTPLGTAGALGLLSKRPTAPFVVMNADVLTKVDLRHLLDFHEQSGAIATMGVRAYDFQIPYGVVSTEGATITAIEEKPIQQIFVNAGIYALNPKVLESVETNVRLDMPELFNSLIANRNQTAAFLIREYWIDVGRMEDFRQANDDYAGVFS